MSEPKPFASLSSGLLARKGAARPAMRPQGFAQAGQSLEDLGWDDMGFEPPKPTEVLRDGQDRFGNDASGDNVAEHPRAHPTGLTPVHSPVHSQQAEIAARVASIEPAEEFDAESDDTAELYEPRSEVAAVPAVEVQPEVVLKAVLESPPEVEAPVPAAVASPRAIAPRRARHPRLAPGSKAKAAFTLRLEPSRHLKLRLACALDGRSAQHLVTDALDQLLAKMPELEAMAASARNKG